MEPEKPPVKPGPVAIAKKFTLIVNGEEMLLHDPSPEVVESLRASGHEVREEVIAKKPRFSKITSEIKERLLELLAFGNTFMHSCNVLDVSPSYIIEYRATHPAYDAKVRAAMKTQQAAMADALYTTGVGGNVTAQIFFLVNRTRFLRSSDPDKWMNTQNIEVSGPGEGPLELTFLSPEERERQILELLVKKEKDLAEGSVRPKFHNLAKSKKAGKTEPQTGRNTTKDKK